MDCAIGLRGSDYNAQKCFGQNGRFCLNHNRFPLSSVGATFDWFLRCLVRLVCEMVLSGRDSREFSTGNGYRQNGCFCLNHNRSLISTAMVPRVLQSFQKCCRQLCQGTDGPNMHHFKAMRVVNRECQRDRACAVPGCRSAARIRASACQRMEADARSRSLCRRRNKIEILRGCW